MKTNLRIAPHYFVIDSIGGMNEGYSDTTCRRVEDVVTPELGKALVEEYIDQWIHDMHEHYEGLCEEMGADPKQILIHHEECKYGGWHKVSFDPDVTGVNFESAHTLFIQVYDGVMLGDGVVIYDQMDDKVTTITRRSAAIRIAEECISLDVERIKRQVHTGDGILTEDLKYANNNLIYAYDCLADVVRSLEYPSDVMVDIDDSCTHYFPVQDCKRLIWLNGSRIQTETQYA